MSDARDDAHAAIRVERVSKRYERRHADAMLLRDLVPHGARRARVDDEFWALRDVSFEVPSGQALAVLGANGSGKTTLLSLIAGATLPTEGRVSVRGRVAPVLGLGVGFEPDMTAVENAYLSASLLGVAERDVRKVLAEILAFADLGDFVDTPVRHYSNGMLARLGFAVVMHVEREIMLVDEVLAVGDLAFRDKCLDRARTLLARGLTLLLVTHDVSMALETCSRGVWLRDGRVELDADIGECVRRYEEFLRHES